LWIVCAAEEMHQQLPCTAHLLCVEISEDVPREIDERLDRQRTVLRRVGAANLLSGLMHDGRGDDVVPLHMLDLGDALLIHDHDIVQLRNRLFERLEKVERLAVVVHVGVEVVEADEHDRHARKGLYHGLLLHHEVRDRRCEAVSEQDVMLLLHGLDLRPPLVVLAEG
jgi:hypothetical protein